MAAETSQTLDRGLRVLEVVAESPDGLTVTELAAALGIGRTVVYRLVVTLEQHAFLRRSADGRCRLGLGVLAMGRQVQPVVRDTAMPALRLLADAVGATAVLTVVDGLEALSAVVVEPTRSDLHVALRAGTRQPLEQVHERARRAGVPLLVHAVQVIGRDPVPAHWDVLAASARDWAGPAGVGVLAVRRHVGWTPEENPDRGWVSGFPDIAGAAAAATALEQLLPMAAAEADRIRMLTAVIRERLPRIADGVEVMGDPEDRLPHIVTFTCTGVTGEAVVDELSRRGYSVASGSACTSDVRMPSQVLAAMGIAADASVRVSLPLGCTQETVDGFLAVLPEALAAARSTLG